MTSVNYQSLDELKRAHPELKNLTVVYHAPRGQTAEKQLAALRAKGVTGTVYQVGDFFWQEAETTQRLCACYERVGDNDNCRYHGRGVTQ